MKQLSVLVLSASLLALAGCGQKPSAQGDGVKAAVETIDPATRMAQEDMRLVTMLDAHWEARVAQSPEYQTNLGRKTNYDQWDDRSPEAATAERLLWESQLADLRDGFDPAALSDQGRLNLDLAVYTYENALKLNSFQDQQFALSQFRGIHSSIPVFLANFHRIDTLEDARAYITRVSTVGAPLAQAATEIRRQAEAGYPLPEFSYPLIVESAQNAIAGAPVTDGPDLSVLTDFTAKVAKLEISDDDRASLISDLTAALKGPYADAYRAFAVSIGETATLPIVDGNFGIGIRPNGAAFYDALLASYTTTDMTANEVHELGLSEVARIHEEMRAIMAEVGFSGSLQDFFEYMRTAPQFYVPNTDEGRETYLQQARDYIDGFTPHLDKLFITTPQAPVEVRRVEPFRERAAGKAFYNQPSEDGTRPGIFYANLADTAQMPLYQLEALVYHEAIPGHHMQRSIQIEMKGLPKFRQFGGYTAFTEGWGLYSELLPKEIGFYEDPYSDFGRLAMELWRAARLVVDTGLHAKGWEMQVAIDYLRENTPNPEGDTVKAIERYIVYPGQATAYKIGMNRIVELRERARADMGDAFDIAAFHDLILTGGPLPLAVLEKRVDAFIAAGRR